MARTGRSGGPGRRRACGNRRPGWCLLFERLVPFHRAPASGPREYHSPWPGASPSWPAGDEGMPAGGHSGVRARGSRGRVRCPLCRPGIRRAVVPTGRTGYRSEGVVQVARGVPVRTRWAMCHAQGRRPAQPFPGTSSSFRWPVPRGRPR